MSDRHDEGPVRRGGEDWVAGLQGVLTSHLERLGGRGRPPEGADRSQPGARAVRIGDADRDRVAELLHTAAAEGRLTGVEVTDRLERAWAARTADELAPLVADLPIAAGDALPGSSPVEEEVTAFFRDQRRTGEWEVPPRLRVVVTLGSAVIDLTRATVRTPEIVLDLAVTGGTVAITVPAGVPVVVDEGLTVFGTWDNRAPVAASAHAGAGVVRVTGSVVGGKVTIVADRASAWRRRRR